MPMLPTSSSAAMLPATSNGNVGTEMDSEVCGGDVPILDTQGKITEEEVEKLPEQQQQQPFEGTKESSSDAAGVLLTLGTSPRLA